MSRKFTLVVALVAVLLVYKFVLKD